MNSDWKTVGFVDVDAGILQLGDPCYTSDGRNHADDWQEFCRFMFSQEDYESGVIKVPHEPGNEGKAVVVSTGYGDGSYPVQVRRDEGRIAEVRVVFIPEEGDEDGEDEE